VLIQFDKLADSGPYDICLADPAWPYTGDPGKNAAAGKHYKLMSLEEIAAVPVRKILAKKAAVFLWATCPRLPDAIQTLANWGLHYRGVAYIWQKTTLKGVPIGAQGVPATFVKPVTEMVLVATTNKTGRPFPILTQKQRQLVPAPRGGHSVKPSVIRERIVELCGDRPRIELFARGIIPNWDTWGLEAQ
jgi:N6-adenosine-specific RNA methylase IME4